VAVAAFGGRRVRRQRADATGPGRNKVGRELRAGNRSARVLSLAGWLGSLAAVAWALSAAGIWLNLSPSMPLGLYRSHHPAAGEKTFPGALVAVCLPTPLARWGRVRGYLIRGRCGSGTAPVGKPVFAVAGDTVSVGPDGLSRNRALAPNTSALRLDRAGRPLWQFPSGTYRVTTGQLWVVSTHTPLSWDSRYYGPVPGDDVVAVLRPIWVVDK
jgi:conjugative transfer signal peptidase TraF